MNSYDAIQRGIDARALLEAPLIVEAFARIEKDTLNELVSTDRANLPQMAALTERIRVIRDLQDHLRSISMTGMVAQQQIENNED